MKIVPSKIVLLIVGFLCCNLTFASPEPPQPVPPVPPGLPIDNDLLVLVIASLILGFYKIYTHKKTSI
jgi:hypothetical protein